MAGASGVKVAIIGPPLLVEGVSALLKTLPFVSSAVTVSESAGIVPAELVVALPALPDTQLSGRWARPGHNILFVDTPGCTAEVRENAQSEGVFVLLSIKDDLQTLRAGFLAGVVGTPYRSKRA